MSFDFNRLGDIIRRFLLTLIIATLFSSTSYAQTLLLACATQSEFSKTMVEINLNKKLLTEISENEYQKFLKDSHSPSYDPKEEMLRTNYEIFLSTDSTIRARPDALNLHGIKKEIEVNRYSLELTEYYTTKEGRGSLKYSCQKTAKGF